MGSGGEGEVFSLKDILPTDFQTEWKGGGGGWEEDRNINVRETSMSCLPYMPQAGRWIEPTTEVHALD